MSHELPFDVEGMKALALTRREYLSMGDLDTLLDAVPLLCDQVERLSRSFGPMAVNYLTALNEALEHDLRETRSALSDMNTNYDELFNEYNELRDKGDPSWDIFDMTVAAATQEIEARLEVAETQVAAVEAQCRAWDIPDPDAGVAYARDEIRRVIAEATP